MKRIILKPGEEKRILAGHPWVYDNEAARVLAPVPGGFKPIPLEELEAGELVDVESAHKTYLGRGLANPHSKIIARIYSPSKEGVDKGFFKRRIRAALAGRLSGYDLRRESARIIFGEADFLPGLIVDRFVGWPFEEIAAGLTEGGLLTGLSGESLTFEKVEAALGKPASWLSVQFLAWGMDCRREEILAALEEVLEKYAPPEFRLEAAVSAEKENAGEPGQGPAMETGLPGGFPLGLPAGIVEKPDGRIRKLEGLPSGDGLIRGSFPGGGIVIFENGFPFILHLEEGQKTGHYLDQKENRLRAAAFAAGGRVLDGCAYTGGFGIHAARFGAAQVTALDVSAAALETLAKNARLNGVEDRLKAVEGDIFEVLRAYERAKERFDLIILDPPAFAKSHSALEGALRGYKEINLRAMKLLSPGGVLVSCSCSQALDEGSFKALITEAACDAERRLLQLDFRYQGSDHPILVGYDESLYLKCGYYRVL
ncbi:MAG: class I SAM-dependent rRNA methyltransferase [Spirochaetaceae bacterium]|jgi:23S rRNA (cytosine1962-C5)-methyltransferase|nr:class I SAM-dependent rRNA methyltransferase [Spirochaetaceae bacterium]